MNVRWGSLPLGLLAGLVLGSCSSLAVAQFDNFYRDPSAPEKLVIETGGGYNVAVGDTRHYQKQGWNYRLGGGYRINRRLEAVIEYSFDHEGVPQQPIDVFLGSTGANSVTGGVHLWAVTLEPQYQFYRSEWASAYVLAGGGFYRKVTKLDEPGAYSIFGAAENIRFSNNAGGVQAGAGVERRLSDLGRTMLFLEARYVWVDNQPSPRNTAYPPANYRTEYVPVTAGVRW